MGQMVAVQKALVDLKSEKLPAKIAFSVAKLNQFVTPLVVRYSQYRTKMLQKYGVPIDDTNEKFRFESVENASEFQAVVNAEESKQVVLPENVRIRLDDLTHLSITPESMEALLPVLIEADSSATEQKHE